MDKTSFAICGEYAFSVIASALSMPLKVTIYSPVRRIATRDQDQPRNWHLLFFAFSTHDCLDDQGLTPRSHRRFAQLAANAVPADISVRRSLLARHPWIVRSAFVLLILAGSGLGAWDMQRRPHASPVPPQASSNVADRGYFKHARDHADGRMLIGEPSPSRGSCITSVVPACGIDGPDGIVMDFVAVTKIDHPLTFYEAISRDPHLSVTSRQDGDVVLARYSPEGTTHPLMPVAPRQFGQIVTAASIYSPPGRAIVSATPVRDDPLTVNVPIREAGWLAESRRQANYVVAASAVLAGTFVVLIWLIARQTRRQDELNATLSRSADALRASVARLSDFAEVASDWFWEQDADLRFTNVGLGSRIRISDDLSYIGKRRWELNDTSCAPEQWEKHRQDVLAHRPFRDFRYDRIGLHGIIYHVSISGVPVYDGSGVFIGYRGTGRDITAQIEAEHDLQQAKDRAERADALFQDAITSIDEGFVIFDAQERLVTCNEGYRRMHQAIAPWLHAGTALIDLLRHDVTENAYPDAIGREQAWIDTWMQRHREAAGATELPLRDGRWVLVTNRRMRNGGTAGLRVDITPLKQAQAALRDSEVRLERAQEIAGIGSWELDVASGDFTWSRQFYRTQGFPLEFKPTRANLTSIMHVDDVPIMSDWVEDLHAGHRRDTIEIRVRRPDGEERLLRIEGRPVVDPDGLIRRLVGTEQDITERRLIEGQLAQAQKMEAIGNLTGGMAHDFNNVLGVIIGNLELLKRLVTADKDASEICGEALDGASRCADLIQRLLTFARRESLNLQRIDINALIEGAARLLRRILGDDIALTLRLDPALRPVMTDSVQLESAMVNFATNARDAMPNGGKLEIVTHTVYLDGSCVLVPPDIRPGTYALIEISDNGTGIPPEIIDHIFEPFFTTKGPGKGSGLGLSMIFGFVKQTGGHLSACGDPALGATFRLYLPSTDISATTSLMPAERLRSGMPVLLASSRPDAHLSGQRLADSSLPMTNKPYHHNEPASVMRALPDQHNNRPSAVARSQPGGPDHRVLGGDQDVIAEHV
jgi:PAS domain S-box-containing protein